MDHYAEAGTSDFPLFVAFFQAQHINLHAGGAVIGPWELLPGHDMDEWAEAAMALSQVPAIRKRKKAEQKWFMDFRRGHETYAQLHGLKKKKVH